MDRLKLLLAHNHYREPGGEDRAFAEEVDLLRRAGHTVIEYTEDNRRIGGSGGRLEIGAAAAAVWAGGSHRRILALLRRERPDLAHFHNTWPLISPAAYYACHRAGVPVVQTLHNYRLFCPAGTFFRAGRTCEECVSTTLLRSIRYGCYRGSRTATAALAATLAAHRFLGTWQHRVDLYIAPSEFSRRKFVSLGLPPERIEVKPNFVGSNGGLRQGPGSYALFVGRLSAEKGLRCLAAAWSSLPSVPLKIVGDGPLRQGLSAWLRQVSADRVQLAGAQPHPEVLELLRGARFLVLPAESYEGFPLVVAEAFSCGVPVIASRLGALEEIVEDGRSGLHFQPADPLDLAAKAAWAWSHPVEMEEMGLRARSEYEAKYSPEINYRRLMEIYERVVSGVRPAQSRASGLSCV